MCTSELITHAVIPPVTFTGSVSIFFYVIYVLKYMYFKHLDYTIFASTVHSESPSQFIISRFLP